MNKDWNKIHFSIRLCVHFNLVYTFLIFVFILRPKKKGDWNQLVIHKQLKCWLIFANINTLLKQHDSKYESWKWRINLLQSIMKFNHFNSKIILVYQCSKNSQNYCYMQMWPRTMQYNTYYN